MNENYGAEQKNKGDNLFAILGDLQLQISSLSEKYKDKSNLSSEELESYEAQKLAIMQKLELVEKCIKIGIIKKTDSMSIDELQDIALQSLSVVSEGINPNEFISEYNRLTEYLQNYKEDLQRRKSIIPDLNFIVEGPLDVLVDTNGNPRSGFIIAAEDQKRVNTFLKKRRTIGNIRLNVKVPDSYFSNEELDRMGYIRLSGALMKGFTVKTPDDYSPKQGEPNSEHPFQSFTITSDSEASKKLSSRYNVYDAYKSQEQLKRMSVILPEIQKKQRLLSDRNYLKEYVQKLLVDSDFVEQYLSSKVKTDKQSVEMQYLYGNDITTLSDENLDNILSSIGSISDENLREIFYSPEKVDMYITFLNSVKRKTKREFPGIWLEPEQSTEEIDKLINEKIGTIIRSKTPVGFQVYPDFINESDLLSLEHNQSIIKEINGVTIPFKLALSRYSETSGYYNEARQQRPEFVERLHKVIDDYRTAISTTYPQQLKKIAECDRKLEALEKLKAEYGQPNVGDNPSFGKPRH